MLLIENGQKIQVRKNSEEYYDKIAHLDSDIPMAPDKWLYQWHTAAPERFILHRTVWREATPRDIASQGWTVLKTAAEEIYRVYGIRKNVKKSMLLLNQHLERPCLLGITGGEYVSAARKIREKPLCFTPFRTYRKLTAYKELKNCSFRCSYRMLNGSFNLGYSFLSDRQNLLCDVSYGINMSVHNAGTIWANIRIGDAVIPMPRREPLSPDADNLLSTIERLNTNSMLFIQWLGAQWLSESDSHQKFQLLQRLTKGLDIPCYVLDSLRCNPQILPQCLTRLDLLLAAANSLPAAGDSLVPLMLHLSRNFYDDNNI